MLAGLISEGVSNYLRQGDRSRLMRLVDVHCHLDDTQFSADLDAVLRRAELAGVKAIVCNGISPASNRAVLALSKLHPLIRPALGLYPIEALKLTDDEAAAELSWISRQKCAALGEVGLDHKWSTDEKEWERQEDVFGRFIALSRETGRALVIHSRKAEQRCFEMVRDAGVRAVFHAFGGRRSLVKDIRDAGFLFSIPPSVLRDSGFQQLVNDVPLSQLLTETDAPYLGPEREGRNEPANVRLAVEKIAALKQLTTEETANVLFANYLRVFGGPT